MDVWTKEATRKRLQYVSRNEIQFGAVYLDHYELFSEVQSPSNRSTRVGCSPSERELCVSAKHCAWKQSQAAFAELKEYVGTNVSSYVSNA